LRSTNVWAVQKQILEVYKCLGRQKPLFYYIFFFFLVIKPNFSNIHALSRSTPTIEEIYHTHQLQDAGTRARSVPERRWLALEEKVTIDIGCV
jgi:hypothetical protein